MQLFYDKQMINLEHEGKFYFYSPINHKRLVVNEYSDLLIKLLLEAEGRVDTDVIKAAFVEKFAVTLKPEDITEQVDRLVKNEMFFTSPEALKEAREKILRRVVFQDKVPDLVYFLLTYRCNFECSYCYLQDTNKDVQELSTEQWQKIATDFLQMGVKNFCLTGGEPLMREDIGEILQTLRTGDSKISLLTNGSLLKEKLHIVDPLVDHMVISFDSFDESIHTANRSSYGYQDILDVIEYYGRTNPKKIKVRAVITKSNYQQMNEFAEKVNKLGIQTIRTLLNPNRPEDIAEVPDAASAIRLDDDLKADLSFGMKFRKCGACYSTIALNPAGDIMPCQAVMDAEFKMGNIFDPEWFPKFLRSETRATFKNINLDMMEVCKDCAWRYLCGGICPALSYKICGDLTKHLACMCEWQKQRAIATLTCAPGEWKDA